MIKNDRSRKLSASDVVKIENRSRKRSHKLDEIGFGRIRTIPFFSDSAYDPVKTRLSESQAEREEAANHCDSAYDSDIRFSLKSESPLTSTTTPTPSPVKTIFFVCNHVTRRPCWWSIQKNFFCKMCIKIEFISQRRETLLFLTTNMAAVTSLANQQYFIT